MKLGSTLFLKLVLLLVGLIVLGICIFVLPHIIVVELAGDFDFLPILIGVYLSAIPFLLAVYQAFRLLGYIENGNVFEPISVQALYLIKLYAFIISGLTTLVLPYVYALAQIEDAPGLFALGLVVVFASGVVGVAAGVFENLLQNAVDMKSDQDLTV